VRNIYYEFLCASLRSDGVTAYTLTRTPGWSWERLFDEANNNSVLPAVSLALRDRIDLPFPSDVSGFLTAVTTLNLERNESIRREIQSVVALLNQIGIEPVLLKGAAYLALGLFSSPAERYLIDIDLLIVKDRVEAAAALLIRNGFARDDSDRFGRFRHHHPPLRRPGSISVEIHHTLATGRSATILPVHEVFERATPHAFGTSRASTPSPEHLVTHLILHSQFVHPYNERIWPPLRALYDLVKLQNRFAESIDWEAVSRRFRKSRHYGTFALHLLDVNDELGLDPPFTIQFGGITRLCWYRRKLLRRWPQIRYFDPAYMFSIVCTRRLRILSAALTRPSEWKYFASQVFRIDVYKRLLSDVVTGSGR
jgi:hypothetical protein